MNAIHRTTFGHWSHAPLHSDKQIERYLEIDEEARRPGKSNFPMGLAAAVVIGLLVALVVHLTFLALQP